MVINMKKFSFFVISILFSVGLFAESEGEKLFKENKPEEAVILLEQEKETGIITANGWNYLGLAYYQLENYEKSAEVFALGLKTPGTNKKVLAYNQGNTYFAMKMYEKAAESYSLTLKVDKGYTQALLNRANAYLMCQKFEESVEDYSEYITLEPEDPQRDSIEELLKMLKAEIVRLEEERIIAEEEAARLAEEERIMQEELERQRIEAERIAEEERLEQERIAEEARKEQERVAEEQRIAREKAEEELRKAEEERLAAEAERRRKLLEDVANSLHNSESSSMSSGAEDLIDYDQESELD